MIKQMSTINKLKQMHVLRWVLIPIVGLIWYFTVGAIFFVLSVVGILNFKYYELFSSMLFSAGWITHGTMLAPFYRKKIIWILWGLSFIFLIFWLQGIDWELNTVWGVLIGGILATIIVRSWDPIGYGPKNYKRTVLLVVIPFILCMFVIIAHYKDFPARQDPLAFELKGVIEPRAFYSVDLGGFIDSSEAWRIDADEKDIVMVANKFAAKETTDIPRQFYSQGPYWWPHSQPTHFRAFKSDGFNVAERGQDGTYFFILYDKDLQRGYVWVMNNF